MDTVGAILLDGHHQWYATNHAKPTYCNVCRDALYGVTSHGFSCEVCKCKVHKQCSIKAINNCKWTTLASIGKDIIEDQDGNITMPHQWMEGNLPVASKCNICEKTCGSVLRLQDWRCLWCKATVHIACRPSMKVNCPLGPAKLSVVPPTALHSIGSDEAWDAVRPVGCSPLLVFVNSKSGDNQGIKFLRRFKQLLNPAQVFDLIKGGPGPGLRLFRHFDPFRILVCSGDGSVGWVLSEIDRLGMHKQCQVGVLPLGTGNDLARVLGWGASCDDDTNFPHLLEKYEKASTKMLDRWSIMIFERNISLPCNKIINLPDLTLSHSVVHEYEDSVLLHITNILKSDELALVISSARVLCETIKNFAIRISETSRSTGDHQLDKKCKILQHKLDLLLQTLNIEENSLNKNDNDTNLDYQKNESLISVNDQENKFMEKPEKDLNNLKMVHKKKSLQDDRAVISRANSLKRAIRQLVEHAEQTVDEQNDIDKTLGIGMTTKSYDEEVTRRQVLTPESTKEYSTESLSITSMLESGASIEDFSPCSSPSPNIESLSPMPNICRDSHPEESFTLPAPDGFADSRRNSSTFSEETVSFNSSNIDLAMNELIYQKKSRQSKSSKISKKIRPLDIHVTMKSTTQDRSPSSDDTTIQDALISPDTDSILSMEVSPECSEFKSGQKIELPQGPADHKVQDLIKCSNLLEIGHIDSPEHSDPYLTDFPNSESITDDLSSLGQDLFSTMIGEKYDSVRESVESKQTEKTQKFCSLAKFVEGNDIARRSFKIQKKKIDKDGIFQVPRKSVEIGFSEEMSKQDSLYHDSSQKCEKNTKKKEPSLFLDTSVCGLKVSSSSPQSNEKLLNFPFAISVIVDPPSPSTSHRSNHNELNLSPLSSLIRRCSGGSMEKLNVEYPEGVRCSPQATRRISSGSLLKANEILSLTANSVTYDDFSNSAKHETAKSIEKTDVIKKLPIINPLVRLPTWPNVNGGLISKALLANADALCAAVSPLMDPDETLTEGYFERCVMNNYFGIGIDAKISLDFHHKREEHPEKCRSRAKNYMWYGVLGSKQWLQKTYKNLDQRVQIECDGQRIPLPSLQGIVILNIPSFMGGTNFWGGSKEGDLFLAPSFDDRILEVVAVFGSVQMAASRLINLQHHRIAQCQTVQINILGDEGVPIQVDGEAWIQPPGIIRIIHKNRMKMLYRNRALETSLRAWEEKQRTNMTTIAQSSSVVSTASRSQCQTQINVRQGTLSEEEISMLLGFIEVVTTLVKWVKLLIISHPSLEPHLYQIATRTAIALEKVHPDGKILQGPTLRPLVTKVVSSARQLYEESCELLRDKAQILKIRQDLENKISMALASMEQELRKCIFDERGSGLVYLQNIPDEMSDKKNRHRGLFWLKFRRSVGGGNVSGSNHYPYKDQVTLWGVQEVCSWLENLQLEEYTENFKSHDIRGRELLTLARRDLKELGITKVGHVKRILQGIHDLNS